MSQQIRPPAVAGSFYPGDKNSLEELIRSFWPTVSKPDSDIKAIIVPHAGYIYSGPVAAAAYSLLKADLYSKIFLIGPSHHYLFPHLASDSHRYWQTPFGLRRLLAIKPLPPFIKPYPDFHLVEHSLEVQLPFLEYHLTSNFQIFPLLISQPDDLEKLAETVDRLLDEKSLLVISSDLSHYYPQEIANEKDKFTLQTILNLNLTTFISNPHIEACGRWAIALLMFIAQKHNWQPRLIKYQTSADTSGDFSSVVGYGAVSFG